jgi:DMSO/TMAO reductase YedYZ molybdopterin-dependent catalytic subunit
LPKYGWHVTTDAKTALPEVPPTGMPRRQYLALAGVLGLVTGVVTIGVAGVIAVFLGISNPLVSVGSLLIDLVPPGVKTLVIDIFGTNDKAFLFVVLGIVVIVAAIFVGILQARRPPWGIVLLGIVGLVALVAAATRANATFVNALPTILGVLVGALVLRALVARLNAWKSATTRKPLRKVAPGQLERRRFLQYAVVSAVVGGAAALGSQALAAGSAAVTAVRKKIKLPAAASAAPTVSADAELHIDGLSPWVIPAASFYRIDTALQVPSVDPDKWKLKITGMVENEIEVSFAELLKLPLTERYITLTCVSQEIGGNLIGNARWLGYPIRELLARAKPSSGADMVLSTSIDGFTAGTPLTVLQDTGTDAILAVGMNGQPLPLEHGFPVRMVVPGLYGYVSATKWVVELKVTTYAKDQGYWTPRGWSAMGPIKLSSRIDTPQNGSNPKAGTVAIAGVAWHQHTGISGVQVQIDGGVWQDAKVAKVVTVDAWLQWSFAWKARRGSHKIAVRAIDAKGQIQTAKYADPAPNGSSGLHTITVNVS